MLKKLKALLLALFLLFESLPAKTEGFTLIILPDGSTLNVELAKTPEEWAKGLMYRENLPEDYGMLFVFKNTDYHYFWMKNTLISLDIIWLNENKEIIYIEENCKPCKKEPCKTYGPNMPAKFVLEVKAGFSKKHSLKPGDKLYFSLP